MDRLLDWGVDVVLWFQQASPQLDTFFAAFTFLGDEEFFLVALPLIYWSINRSVGVRLMVVFLLSGLVNQVAKHLAAQPRPFAYDSRVVVCISRPTFWAATCWASWCFGCGGGSANAWRSGSLTRRPFIN